MSSHSAPAPRPAGSPDEPRARAFACRRLARLPAALTYHSLAHTRDDVVPAAERLAARLGVAGEALVLLRTAAYFHDLGFAERRAGHELVSARLAARALPRYGYAPAQVATIEALIMATQVPQAPRTPLEEILCDADLDSLGRPDFLRTSLVLRAELATFEPEIPAAEWYARQLAFLRGHQYFTAAARALRDAGKRSNIAQLERLLEQARKWG